MVAWLPYVPVPGLSWVAVQLRPNDRLVRFHAWQGGILVVALWASMVLVGLLLKIPGTRADGALGFLGGLLLLVCVAGLLLGAIGAVRRRFTRVRGAWDLAVRLSKA